MIKGTIGVKHPNQRFIIEMLRHASVHPGTPTTVLVKSTEVMLAVE